MNGQGILSGLRIVEVSAFVAAPLGGMTLAQMGADVIRIDPPGGGLDYRRWPVTESGVSLFWAGLNKSKRSVAIDINKPEGRELAQALVTAGGDDAGILLTNFPPRGWLDYESLRTVRADLIQMTIQGDRHGGSMLDYTVNPTLGLPYITGPADRAEPSNHVLPAWDLVTGQMAALGLLAAERHRRKTRAGQHLKLALEDVGLAVMAHLGFIAEAQLGQKRGRYGNDLFGAFGRDFVCADGERVMVVALTGKQWKGLCEACEIAGAVQALEESLGVDLRREDTRFRYRDAIAELVGPWILERSFAEVSSAFKKFGACWSRYQSVAQLASSKAVDPNSNPMFTLIDQLGVGRVAAPGIPVDFSAFERLPAEPAPKLGAHTEEVLITIVGVSSAQFGALVDRGIVALA